MGVLVLTAIGLWGAYESLQTNRHLLKRAAFTRLRSQALQRVGHIESGLSVTGDTAESGVILDSPWLERYWQGVDLSAPGQLYAALVDSKGIIRFHNDDTFVGRTLEGRWYLYRAEEDGTDIAVIDAKILNEDHQAYDIEVPITVDGRTIAFYHEGVAKPWLDQQIADRARQVAYRWAFFTIAIMVSALGSMLLIRATVHRAFRLQQEAHLWRLEREAQLGVLAAGLAHEVRNPLHAIRLNLNTLETLTEPQPTDTPSLAASAEVLKATEAAVTRIDQLVSELLDYAKPATEDTQRFDAVQAIGGVAELMRQELGEAGVRLRVDTPAHPTWVRFPPNQLRQILVNLLLNARDAQPQGGTIHIELLPGRKWTQIAVADEGPGVPEHEVRQLFQPFFTTKESGTGFGLALSQRFLQQHGGSIRYEPRGAGARFVVEIPSAKA